jgi:hypothetical protein
VNRIAQALGLVAMSNLDRRRGYTPRRAREQRAYRLIQVGGVTGTLGVVGLVFAIVGVIGAGLPIVLLIVAAICFLLFQRTTGQR